MSNLVSPVIGTLKKNENDDNDLRFDAVSDDEEIMDTEFLDSSDGWNLFPDKLKNASDERIISASNIGILRACVVF